MKRLTTLLFALPLLVLFLTTSCEEDLSYPGIQAPVVFALLDKTDSIHYVKITHSFGGDQNAVQVALIPDSSYYADIDVKIEEWIPTNANGSTMIKMRSWTLEDTIITNKQPGTFYSPDQKVYYFKTEVFNNSSPPDDYDTNSIASLKQSATYKLIAVVNGGEYTINSETKLVEEFQVTTPSSTEALGLVTSTSNNISYTIFHPSASFLHNANSPKIFNGNMKVYFNEFFNGVAAEKSFEMGFGQRMGDDEVSATGVSFDVDGQIFYKQIKATVTNDPGIDKRQLKKINVSMTGGSDALYQYILSNQPLASALIHVKDSYTNVTCSDGRKAVGVFTSTYTVNMTKQDWDPTYPNRRAITSNSVKILCTGSITGALLFCSDNPLDDNTSYSCQ